MPDQNRIFAIATANRLLAADLFARLTDEQWRTPSLCAGWSVRVVAAHLVPLAGGYTWSGMARQLLRFRGNLNRMVDTTAREAAEAPVDQIVHDLRERARTKLNPPVIGPQGPMTDTAIHLRDAARPLGYDVSPPPTDWIPVLDFLVSRTATRGFMPSGRLHGLSLRATDAPWQWNGQQGPGTEVRGTCEALAMAVSGRAVYLPELEGEGTSTLAARL